MGHLLRTRCELAFQRESPSLLADMHWGLFSPGYSFTPDLEGCWGNAELVCVEKNPPVHTLGLEDNLLFLSLHASKHDWQRLIWLVDLAELLRQRTEVDWERLLTPARMRRRDGNPSQPAVGQPVAGCAGTGGDLASLAPGSPGGQNCPAGYSRAVVPAGAEADCPAAVSVAATLLPGHATSPRPAAIPVRRAAETDAAGMAIAARARLAVARTLRRPAHPLAVAPVSALVAGIRSRFSLLDSLRMTLL